ncbi:prepilin peptidase [Vibrio quintilis]|uniref:Type IV leader peptidase family protein n=1 Tax=Vibrio quintilis TaxID=1117707 RepID=A0A1M7YVD3_9VIBR|nr:A24 family peptidase [Vibrio quintilis]SHO56521.1 Type IV leader peptidase family protein [Vibrio quintilis]
MILNISWQLAGWFSLVILSLIACGYDLWFRVIPNPVCLIIFLISLVISPNLVTPLWALQVSGVTGLLLVFYRYQIWGGGDVKLLLAFLPAINEQFLLLAIALIGLTGGVLCAFYLLCGVFTGMKKVREKGLPFAIPISCVCLLCVTASLKG